MRRADLPFRLSLALVAFTLTSLISACGGPSSSGGDSATGHGHTSAAPEAASVIVYSGRNESLVQPILDRFSEQTGVEVKVRYGGTAELAATILEEGDATPADVYISQDAGALGALAAAGRFQPLAPSVLDRIPGRFRSPEGLWVGLSGRARTVVYNPERIQAQDLPQSLEAATAPRYKGTFGIAPTNASFQAHMAVYRAVHGAEASDALLTGLAANEPELYPKNSAIVEAVIAGEVDWGLVNHYYLWRVLVEQPDVPGKNFVMPEGDASSFVNLAGAGLLRNGDAARKLVEFLVGDEAQQYFAQETYEYPLASGMPASVDLTPLADLPTPEVNFAEVSGVLEETLGAIRASGLTP